MIYKPEQIEMNKGFTFASKLWKAGKCVEIKAFEMTRSNKQNRAFRLYWKLLAIALDSEGCEYQSRWGKTLKFTSFVIESDWRERMQEMYGITSTKDLTTEMINNIYDCMNLDYSTIYGISKEFPSFQTFLNELDKKNFNI